MPILPPQPAASFFTNFFDSQNLNDQAPNHHANFFIGAGVGVVISAFIGFFTPYTWAFGIAALYAFLLVYCEKAADSSATAPQDKSKPPVFAGA